MSTYPITGIHQGLGPASNQVPLRQEVDAWSSNPANVTQVNLFLLALAKFQAMSVTDMKSYYQVAGIHGLPLVPWDEKTASKTPGSLNGYCTHNSILFPNWHRPYLLLFEQRIYEIMTTEIIPTFPANQQADLTAAANTWRLPYWDWAAKKVRGSSEPDYAVPLIVLNETIEVSTPTGQSTIKNPMYSFTTPQPMGDYGVNSLQSINEFPYDQCKATSRCPPQSTDPASTAWINGVENNDQVDDNLRNDSQNADPLGEAVYRLFSEDYFANYDAFSSTRFSEGQPPPDYLSCEGIHNNIHSWVGGDTGGHMSEVPVAAFDPIFWLHHANVDRQFAIWQTLNPTVWFSDRNQQLSDDDGNWSTRPRTIDTPKTALSPFHTDTHGTSYTSDGVRDWTKLGYSYTELQPWLPKYVVNGQFSEDTYLSDVREQVNSLYSTTRNLLLKTPQVNLEVTHDDYVVNVIYKKFALGGAPFTILIFVGDTKVGSVYNFSTPAHTTGGPDGCENCRNQEEAATLATSQVPITDALLRDVENKDKSLGTLKPEEVEKYLKEKLNWKVTKAGGVNVPLPSIPSLKVSLAAGKGTHFKDNKKLSNYGDYKVLYSVTEGRDGGLGQKDPH